MATSISEITTGVYIASIFAICLPFLFMLAGHEIEESRRRSKHPKGCRKLGIIGPSNLSDEFDVGSSGILSQGIEKVDKSWRLRSMWIYPLKSCRGIELDKATIIASGMEYDRQFTFAQLKSPFPVSLDTPESEKAAHKWSFVTQREYPLLALVKVEMWIPDETCKSYTPELDEVESGGVIIASFPYQRPGFTGGLEKWWRAIWGQVPEKQFRIPFHPTSRQIERAGHRFEDMTIWKETVSALNLESLVPEEFRYFLGMSNKLGLFRVDAANLREVYRNAPVKEDIGYQPVTGFQDAYPLHLLNIASVRDVESKISSPAKFRLPTDRFRANLIISGPEPYTEDTWKRIKIGQNEYDVSARTARCKMPNIDQLTGERHPAEPDRTLRKERAVDEGAGPRVGCLGMQMVPLREEGLLCVGDEITVLGHGEHCYIHQ